MAYPLNTPNYTGGEKNGYKYNSSTPKNNPVAAFEVQTVYTLASNQVVATPSLAPDLLDNLQVTIQDEKGQIALGVIDVATPAAINISTSGLSKTPNARWVIVVNPYKAPLDGIAYTESNGSQYFNPNNASFTHEFKF